MLKINQIEQSLLIIGGRWFELSWAHPMNQPPIEFFVSGFFFGASLAPGFRGSLVLKVTFLRIPIRLSIQ